MNTDPTNFPTDDQPEPPPDSGDRREPTRSGRVSSGLALIIAGIALLGSGYLWYTLFHNQPELLQTDVSGTLTRLERENRELRESLADTDEELRVAHETQETMKAALDKIQTDLSRNRTDWMVAEAEQLLLTANRRLQLSRDVTSALAALQAADRQIELLASPNLLPVRRQLAREIALLETIERTDTAGMSLQLGGMADSVDRLPLTAALRTQAEQSAAASNQTAAAPSDEQRLTAHAMWQDLLSLVRIRHNNTAEKPLLPPEQQYFVRENLRLMLYGAQHALLQGNVATYQQNLKTAHRWLTDYFDPNSQAVTAALADLEKMQATPVMAELPNINTSLELLRKSAGRRQDS
ncbi:MAG: uroporphyrinogen-III C-methyltransferase [Gammaproteobacteria bacterium]|nr:uroporphyrinogen-III C-methyltransferase [Gammaproteobacteria bacterium]